MKLLRLLIVMLCCELATLYSVRADTTPSATSPQSTPTASANGSSLAGSANASPTSGTAVAKANAQQQQTTTNAVAADYSIKHPTAASHLLERLVDHILARFDLDPTRNTPTRYGISALCIVVALILRGFVTIVVFGIAKRFAKRTTTTLDDKLFPALQRPVSIFILVLGFVLALRVLKLSDEAEVIVDYSTTIAFSLVIFWLLFRTFATILDHGEEVARDRKLGIAAFSPWIKKTLITFFLIIGVLLLLQSLGYNVGALLTGLGIGGLAFALAAQDTLANLFGSVVIAIDQPFKIGEFVQIGANSGSVEDIGLRSTRLRRSDKSLLVIPNKTVAGEVIVNLSRFTQRRVEQNVGLTYDSPAEQIDGIVEDIRQLLVGEAAIEKPSVFVQFADFGPSSLVISLAYQTLDPDFNKQAALKQTLNLRIMQAVAARKLAFAFPTHTVQFDGPVARRIVEKSESQGS